MTSALIGLVLSFFDQPIVYAYEPIEPKVILIATTTPIETLIHEKAEKYNRDPEYLKAIIACESQGSTTVQSYHIQKDGTRENSWGLSQINLDWNPNVTKEQAQNPEFAVEFLARNLGTIPWSCEKLI